MTPEQCSSWVSDAVGAGLTGLGLGGIRPEEWEIQKAIRLRFHGQIEIFTSFGWHPWECQNLALRAEAEGIEPVIESCVRRLESEILHAHAIGETGLDLSRRFNQQEVEIQQLLFVAQLSLALTHHKPLVLHVVNAHTQAHALMRDGLNRDGHARYSGIIHSFSGTTAEALTYVDLGFLISIGPSILRKGFGSLKAAVVGLDTKHLVFETDAPDQAGRAKTLVKGGRSSDYSVGDFASSQVLLEVVAEVTRLKGLVATVDQVLGDASERFLCTMNRLG